MLKGDTIRLKCQFRTFSGKEIDPTGVKLKIYNSSKNQIEEIILSDTNKEKVGVYFYDYVPDEELNEFIFEFVGTYDDNPILSRGKVDVKFI